MSENGKAAVMDDLIGTKQAAKRLGVAVSHLSKSIWLGRVEQPIKGPGGAYFWTTADLEKAAWAMRHKSLAAVDNEQKQLEKENQ